MSRNLSQEQVEQIQGVQGAQEQEQIPEYSNQMETLGLNPEKINPLLIDNKQVYYQGFLSLNDEDKARVLLGFLLTSHASPDINNFDPEVVEKTKAKHELWKDKELFSIKKYGSIGFLALVGIAIVVFFGLFVYTTLKQGVLDENGILTGLLTSVQEVLRILFTSPGDI